MVKCKKTSLIVIVLNTFFQFSNSLCALDLPVPDDLHAVMPTQQFIGGIFPVSDRVWLFPAKQAYMIGMPFRAEAKKRDEKFGRIEEHVRVTFENLDGPADWRGIYGNLDQAVVWDAKHLKILALRKKDFSPIIQNSVPIDLIKPPLDRGGEATKNEISSLRKSFRIAFNKQSDNRFTGIAEIPDAWDSSPGRKFLIGTRIDGFPLVMMVCSKDDLMSCVVSRQCYLNGASSSLNSHLTGIAVDKEKREVLFGNDKDNSIEIFRFNSCRSLKYSQRLRLPSNMAKIGAIAIDNSWRLWTTTGIMDTPFDANVFYWDKSQWQSSSPTGDTEKGGKK